MKHMDITPFLGSNTPPQQERSACENELDNSLGKMPFPLLYSHPPEFAYFFHGMPSDLTAKAGFFELLSSLRRAILVPRKYCGIPQTQVLPRNPTPYQYHFP